MIIKGRAIVVAGQPGPANSLSIGNVVGGPAAATITGSPPSQVLNLSLPPGANGETPTFSIGTITTLTSGSSATVSITGAAPNYVLNFGLPAGAAGTNAATPVLTIGTVSTLAAGSSAAASITGSAPNFVLNLGIPIGNTGAPGVGLSPGTAISTAVTLGAAFRATDTTKSHFLSVMIDVAYSITVAAALADVVELWVGPVAADVAAGNTTTAKRVASFRSSLTGIALSVGMGSGDRGQLTWLVPAGHYCAVRRTTGTTATISEVFMQPLT